MRIQRVFVPLHRSQEGPIVRTGGCDNADAAWADGRLVTIAREDPWSPVTDSGNQATR